MKIESSDVFSALATMLATFVGAWLAFKWQKHLEDANEERENIAAGNRALITIWQQLSSLRIIQLDCIAPVRSHPGRHIAMKPLLPVEEPPRRHPVKDLDFLITKGHKKILFDLLLEEERYSTATEAIRARSAMHQNIVQPKLEAAGIREGQGYGKENFEKALGDKDYKTLERLTDAAIAHVDRTVESLGALKSSLRAALTSIYPKADFVDYELEPDPPVSISP